MKEETFYLGIDPGASGGVAEITGGNVYSYSMKEFPTERDIWGWFERYVGGSRRVLALIEKVSGYIGAKQPGSAMFKFGQGYGFLRGCLIAAEIPFEEVPPQTWQKGLGIPPRGKKETKTQWKNRLKARSQQLFPREEITLAVSDAILLAVYCQRKAEGRL